MTATRAQAAGASCRAGADGTAELAVLVEDAWQRRGLGTRLLTQLIMHADRSGIRILTATVLGEQAWILRALRSCGTCRATVRMGTFQVTVRREPHLASALGHRGQPPAGPPGAISVPTGRSRADVRASCPGAAVTGPNGHH